jgi:hypothetical protein
MASIARIVEPAVLPLSLDEVKAQLRVTTNDENDLISSYIKAATDFIEGEWGFLGRALVTQTWRLTLDAFPASTSSVTYAYCGPMFGGGVAGQIKIPLPPLQSIVQIAYDDANGDAQIIDPANYFVDSASEPGWVVPAGNMSWPSTLNAINTVRVDFVAGYPPDSSSPPDLTARIPANIKQAMLLMVSNWMEFREGFVESRLTVAPFAADILLRRHKIQKSLA